MRGFFLSWRPCRLTIPNDDRQSFGILEPAATDDDEVDERPEAEAAKREYHQYARADLADIKTMDAKRAEEKAQDGGRKAAFRAGAGRRVVDGMPARRAGDGHGRNLVRAIRTLHSERSRGKGFR